MVQEEDRGQPPDEELMSRSQGSSTEPSGGALRTGGAVPDKDSATPKPRLAEQSAGPSGKSGSADGSCHWVSAWWSRWWCRT